MAADSTNPPQSGVSPEAPVPPSPTIDAVRQWLAEGDALHVVPRPAPQSEFADVLTEKFRKQGLVF
jgi:hypothetical protein